MEKLFKQPNGKYCKINSRGEMVFFDYTEQDVIDMYIKKAKEEADKASSYKDIIKEIEHHESRGQAKAIGDDLLELMGFNKPYSEMVLFVPRQPTNTSYAPCDFTTYGKCPSCGRTVQDGMGHTDEKCPTCGQILKWKNT